MSIPDQRSAKRRGRVVGPTVKRASTASRSPEHKEVRAPIYDKVDRRLMDTFPASDAVAQF